MVNNFLAIQFCFMNHEVNTFQQIHFLHCITRDFTSSVLYTLIILLIKHWND